MDPGTAPHKRVCHTAVQLQGLTASTLPHRGTMRYLPLRKSLIPTPTTTGQAV